MSLLYFPPAYHPPGYFPPGYFPTGSGVALPTSLLDAITTYWAAQGLDDSIARLRVHRVHANTPTPFVVIEDVREDVPGETRDNRPVEMWLTIWASGDLSTRVIARAIRGRFGDPDDDPPLAVPRAPFTWDGGSELSAEHVGTQSEVYRDPTKAGPIFRRRMQYRFWIEGRA